MAHSKMTSSPHLGLTTSHIPATMRSSIILSTLALLFLLTAQPLGAAAASDNDRPQQASGELIELFSNTDPTPIGGAGQSGGAGRVRSEALTEAEFESLLTSVTHHSEEFVSKLLGPCVEGEDSNCTWKQQCPGTSAIYQWYNQSGLLSAPGLIQALPIALHTLSSPECVEAAHAQQARILHGKHKSRPTTLQTWLYGSAFCSLVVLISNIGACLGACMETKFFKRLLQFLVSMGAGSLASTGLLVLIPEAFDLMSVEELGETYIWKATVAILSIFTFFCSERLLKAFLYNKESRAIAEKESDSRDSQPLGNQRKGSYSGDCGDGYAVKVGLDDLEVEVRDGGSFTEGHGHSHAADIHDRKTLAWMVMAGDVIHNFVDGLSVGAAFTEDIGLGISVSLAILCEELPHELADIAILLHSGLSIKRAVLINFLSACVCYIGLVLGIVLGSTIENANKWIFAMAGGLFLYVPLVDMLPDMRLHLDQLVARGDKEARLVALLHLMGLLIGTFIILVIVNVNSLIVV